MPGIITSTMPLFLEPSDDCMPLLAVLDLRINLIATMIRRDAIFVFF